MAGARHHAAGGPGRGADAAPDARRRQEASFGDALPAAAGRRQDPAAGRGIPLMYRTVLILLLLAGPAAADSIITCPQSLTIDTQGRVKAWVQGRCQQNTLMLQTGGALRLQNGGRILCQSTC